MAATITRRKIGSKRITLSELNKYTFYLAYIPWVMAWMFTSSYLKDTIHPYRVIAIWQYIGIAALVLRLFIIKRTSINKIFMFFMLFIVSLLVISGNGNASLVFYSVVMILAANDLKAKDIKEAIKVTFYLQIFSLLLITGLSLINVIPNEMVTSYAGGYMRRRHGLGYTFTTFAPNFLFSIAIEYCYLKRDKSHVLIQSLLFLLVDVFFFRQTGTRVSFYFTILAILIHLVMVYRGERDLGKAMKIIYGASFPFMCVLSLIISINYNPSRRWMLLLNALMSQRLRFAQNGLRLWGVSLFGISVQWYSDAAQYNYIDCSYVNILVCYGILIFIFTLIGFTVASIRSAKGNNRYLCYALMLWAIRAALDPQLFLLWFDPFLLLTGFSIINKKINYQEL